VQTVTIEDPRPIDEALQMLHPKYGRVVTYEDPPYTYEGDLKDVTEATSGANSRSQRVRTLIPIGGSVSINVPDSGNDSHALGSVLSQLLQSHAALQRGGHFRLQEEDGVFHVIPTEVRDRNGNWQTLVPVLDSEITIPKLTDANGIEMLNAICDAVSNASGVRVLAGTMPQNILEHHRGDLQANNEVARTVLLRALKLSSSSLSWSMLYDAALKMYFLNVRPIDVLTVPPGSQLGVTTIPAR
jgi:hypothetical protein